MYDNKKPLGKALNSAKAGQKVRIETDDNGFLFVFHRTGHNYRKLERLMSTGGKL